MLDPAIARKVLTAARTDRSTSAPNGSAARLARLSPQEQRVLELIAAGHTNKEISEAMKLGEGTVRNYLTSVFTKLEVANRTEAVAPRQYH